MTTPQLLDDPVRRTVGAVESPQRVAAVRDSVLLETGPEEAFNRLTRLASTLLGTPLVFLTVVDDVRSFLKGAPDPELLCGPDGTFEVPAREAACQVVVDTGTEVVAGDVSEDPRLRDLPQIRQFGVAAWVGVPFVGPDGRVLGNLCAFDTAVRTWSEADLEALRTLAAAANGEVALRVALRQSRARAAQAAELAETLQESLVPAHPPRIPGVEIAAVFRPGGTGIDVLGDFYDVLPVDGGFGVVVGDVCGHGAAAARTTAMARSAVRTSSHIEPAPAAALITLNEVMALWFGARRGFISAVYATVHRPRPGEPWTVVVASAGHPPGLVHRADGTVELLRGGGRVLGLTEHGEVAEELLELRAGDSLVLSSDGIGEARDRSGAQLDDDGVIAALAAAPADASPEVLAEALVGAAVAHVGGDGTLADDAAVVVVRISPPTPPPPPPAR